MLRRYLLLIGLFTVGACGGSTADDETATGISSSMIASTSTVPSATTVPSAESTAAPAPVEDERCLPVDQAKLDEIAAGLEIVENGTLRNGRAVKSDDYKQVYMIAADIEGPGMDGADQIAVWASDSTDPGVGLIFAVDAVAQGFSTWGDGDTTDAEITINRHGVNEAMDCVRSLS